MATPGRIASLVATSLLFVGACTGDGDQPPVGPSIEEPAPCPDLGAARRIGTIGGKGDAVDPAALGISGLGVGTFDQGSTTDPLVPVAWAVGDRYGNEAAGDDSVFLFELDPRNGDELSRFEIDGSSLEPGPGGDTVTSLEDDVDALPDFEELSVEPQPDGPDRIWLFDTGNNEGARDHLNAYVVNAPGRPGLQSGVITPARYPFELRGPADFPALDTEAAIADPARGETPMTVYLIPKFPVDLDDDGSASEFPVYAFEPDLDDRQAAMNDAAIVGHITLDDPALRVTAASASRDGTAFAVRAVSGGEEGQPHLDQVALWQRDPTTSITSVLAAHPTPDCVWSFDTAEGSSAEETLAFDLRHGPAWSGLLWTHDLRDPGAPLFEAPRR